MNERYVQAGEDWALTFIKVCVETEAVEIHRDAHGHLSSYNEGRVDAYRNVATLCDRLIGPTGGPQADGTGQP
jgi:hypothetical protein